MRLHIFYKSTTVCAYFFLHIKLLKTVDYSTEWHNLNLSCESDGEVTISLFSFFHWFITPLFKKLTSDDIWCHVSSLEQHMQNQYKIHKLNNKKTAVRRHGFWRPHSTKCHTCLPRQLRTFCYFNAHEEHQLLIHKNRLRKACLI